MIYKKIWCRFVNMDLFNNHYIMVFCLGIRIVSHPEQMGLQGSCFILMSLNQNFLPQLGGKNPDVGLFQVITFVLDKFTLNPLVAKQQEINISTTKFSISILRFACKRSFVLEV